MVWAFIVILLFLHFDLSEIIAFARYLPITQALPATSETCPLPVFCSRYYLIRSDRFYTTASISTTDFICVSSCILLRLTHCEMRDIISFRMEIHSPFRHGHQLIFFMKVELFWNFEMKKGLFNIPQSGNESV